MAAAVALDTVAPEARERYRAPEAGGNTRALEAGRDTGAPEAGGVGAAAVRIAGLAGRVSGCPGARAA
jgi:hypothetical protein